MVRWVECLRFENILKATPKKQLNGAGPQGLGRLVPDFILGLCITEAANIHDAMYYFIQKKNRYGSTFMGSWYQKRLKEHAPLFDDMLYTTYARSFADDIFLSNMNILNKNESKSKTMYALRIPIIRSYYYAVRIFGDKYSK